MNAAAVIALVAAVVVVLAVPLALARRAFACSLRPVVLASAPDPGNAPHLVELIGRRGPADDGRRWVRVVNGTAPHTVFRLDVEDWSTDPIAAVAATYGMSAREYLACTERS